MPSLNEQTAKDEVGLLEVLRLLIETKKARTTADLFFGNGVVAWSGRQLRMDVIVGMMPAPLQKFFALLSELVFIAVALMIVWFAWPVIRDLWNFDQRSRSALRHDPRF